MAKSQSWKNEGKNTIVLQSRGQNHKKIHKNGA
jgi:hypothetical protein